MKASRTSLAELECKLPGLPAETQASVRAIMHSANNILGCMATDPRDVDHGARFLKRYLAATHGIVDTHLRFAHDKDISPDVASALARSNDMLARLKVAFAKEHALLLQNDVTDFSADLKTLDTLLKMDGSLKTNRKIRCKRNNSKRAQATNHQPGVLCTERRHGKGSHSCGET